MDTSDHKTLVLLSGGIDSTVLTYRLNAENHYIIPFYVDYGQLTSPGELLAINTVLPPSLLQRLIIIRLPEIKALGSGSLIGEYPLDIGSRALWLESEFFPNRNMILLSLAAAYCYKAGCTKIAIGLVGKQSYTDTSMKFVRAMSTALQISLGNIQIIAPYTEQPRKIIAKDAVKYNVPLENTFSCNSLGDRHCMFCTSCVDREATLVYFHDFKK